MEIRCVPLGAAQALQPDRHCWDSQPAPGDSSQPGSCVGVHLEWSYLLILLEEHRSTHCSLLAIDTAEGTEFDSVQQTSSQQGRNMSCTSADGRSPWERRLRKKSQWVSPIPTLSPSLEARTQLMSWWLRKPFDLAGLLPSHHFSSLEAAELLLVSVLAIISCLSSMLG